MPPSTFLDYSSFPSKWSNIAAPPDFATVTGSAVKKRTIAPGKYDELKMRRAWDLAMSPAKSLPMNAFMLYMSGGGVQIFSIGILVMLLFNPFKAIAGMSTVFAPFRPTAATSGTDPLLLPKLLYFTCNLLTVALGLWKCRSMGLLPTGTGDWLAFETRGVPPEISLR